MRKLTLDEMQAASGGRSNGKGGSRGTGNSWGGNPPGGNTSGRNWQGNMKSAGLGYGVCALRDPQNARTHSD